MILCRHDTEVSQWYKGRRWFDAFGPLYSCQNQRILFEICFVTNCKIGIIEHPQVHLTAALLKITILEHIFDKYRWNKIRQGGRWGWVSAEILIISHHNIMEGNSVSVRSLLFGLVLGSQILKKIMWINLLHDFVLSMILLVVSSKDRVWSMTGSCSCVLVTKPGCDIKGPEGNGGRGIKITGPLYSWKLTIIKTALKQKARNSVWLSNSIN